MLTVQRLYQTITRLRKLPMEIPTHHFYRSLIECGCESPEMFENIDPARLRTKQNSGVDMDAGLNHIATGTDVGCSLLVNTTLLRLR